MAPDIGAAALLGGRQRRPSWRRPELRLLLPLLRPVVFQLLLVALALLLQGCGSAEKAVALFQQSWTGDRWFWQHRVNQGKRPAASSLLQRSAVVVDSGEDEEDGTKGSEEEEEDDDTRDATANLESEDETDNSKDDSAAAGGSRGGKSDSNAVGADALNDDDAAEEDLEPAPGADSPRASGSEKEKEAALKFKAEGLPQLRGAGGAGSSGQGAESVTTTHDPAAEYTSLVQRHAHRQQKELNDQYEQMLYLSDPDDIDKAMKLAWMKMEYEDRTFTGAMQKRFRPRKKPRVALPQVATMLNTRRLNTGHDEAAATSTATSSGEQAADRVALADF